MKEPRRIRILIVEDHFLARLAVSTLITGEPDMTVVGQAESGKDVLSLFSQLLPDIVLMDLRMPEMDGIAATAALVAGHPNARVLVLSHYEREEDVARALDAGALGYLKKDVDGGILLEAIRRVAGGGRHIPAQLKSRIEDRAPRSSLSKRELEVLQCVFDGLSNPEIAEELDITEGTARIHVSNILLKLGVKRRTEAVAVALKRGLLRSE